MDDDVNDIQMLISNSGATATCPFCMTQYDNWAVDIEDYVPPVGDGCAFCTNELVGVL